MRHAYQLLLTLLLSSFGIQAIDEVLLYSIHAENEPNMRSLNSNYQTKVTFVNARQSAVHLWWLNFDGKRVSYGFVKPGATQETTTYETHPWLITDENTNQALGLWTPVMEWGTVIIG